MIDSSEAINDLERFMIDCKNWYVLYTRPQTERKIGVELLHRSIEYLLPITQVERQWSDRKRIVDVVLFPNYVFIYTSLKEMYNVLDLRGAVKYISQNGRPVILKETLIDYIRGLSKLSPQLEVETRYKKGDKVIIRSGPLCDLTGYIIGSKSGSRFYLELPIINQTISVDISSLDLLKIQ